MFYLAAAVALFISIAGCSKGIRAYTPRITPSIDDAYLDLSSGRKLLVVVPLLKSGGFRAELVPEAGSETLSFSAKDVIGYTVSHYSVVGKSDGAVRLRFTAAEITRDGKTVRDLRPPLLPLQLPSGVAHIRLVYEMRLSHTDHNMAIVAASCVDALDAFTRQLESDPGVCGRTMGIFCSWVPTGVAVRSESK